MTEISQSLYRGETLQIASVYPELGNLTIKAGDLTLSFHHVDLDVMLDLVKGLTVTDYVSILSNNGSTHGRDHTKQDIIDFIENLMADREMEAKVKAEIQRQKEKANDAPTV